MICTRCFSETVVVNAHELRVELVGRAGFEPATLRSLRVRLVGWVTPTGGGRLQRLRQPNFLDLC